MKITMTPTIERQRARFYTQKSKKINPVYVRNTESSLEQQNSFFAFLQKVNNSITTKLCVNLINNRKIF